MKFTDITGQKFGRLLVLKRDGYFTKEIAWLCKCDCGNLKRTRGQCLKTGRTKSCGCINKEKASVNRFPDRSCICEICGKKFTSKSLYPRKACSKECHNKRMCEQVKARNISSFDKAIGVIAARCKTKAKRTGIPCDISKEFLLRLFEKQNKQCCKTGIKLGLRSKPGVNNKGPWDISIDQIDPGKGYTKNNVQFVCSMYNQAKMHWSHADVINFCKATVNYE